MMMHGLAYFKYVFSILLNIGQGLVSVTVTERPFIPRITVVCTLKGYEKLQISTHKYHKELKHLTIKSLHAH
jgi:hypothetical protein